MNNRDIINLQVDTQGVGGSSPLSPIGHRSFVKIYIVV